MRKQILTTHEEMEEAVWNFYDALLGTAQNREIGLSLPAFYPQLHYDLWDMDSPISEQEVWEVIRVLRRPHWPLL